MLIRIGEEKLYNTEADCVIEHKFDERYEWHFDDDDNWVPDKSKPVTVVEMVISENMTIEGEEAATVWMALTNAAWYQENTLMGKS